MSLPERKNTRLSGFDYTSENYYFVTVCTYEKKCLFGNAEKLNRNGLLAQEELVNVPSHFSGVRVDKFVVMPNHIHAIVVIAKTGGPSLSTIIGLYKSGVSRWLGTKVW